MNHISIGKIGQFRNTIKSVVQRTTCIYNVATETYEKDLSLTPPKLTFTGTVQALH